jgi:hypothetical protein
MTQIILNVDDTVGKIFSSFSEESKQQFTQTVSLMVKKALNDETFAAYSKLLDTAGSEAVRNGLTPEILRSLII